MKPTDKQVVEWAREAEVNNAWDINWFDPYYAKFAALAYEAGVIAEREACAYRAGIALLGADRGLANRVDYAIRERGKK